MSFGSWLATGMKVSSCSSHWAEVVLFCRALPLGIPPIGYTLFVSSSTRPGDIVKEARFLDKDKGEGGSIISCW